MNRTHPTGCAALANAAPGEAVSPDEGLAARTGFRRIRHYAGLEIRVDSASRHVVGLAFT